MKHDILAASVVMACALLTQPARAEFVSGNTLYEWCSARPGSVTFYQDESSCREYILGVHDALESAGYLFAAFAEMDDPFEMVCVPPRVQAGQLKEVVATYLRNNPAPRHEGAAMQVMLALRAAYPCGSKS